MIVVVFIGTHTHVAVEPLIAKLFLFMKHHAQQKKVVIVKTSKIDVHDNNKRYNNYDTDDWMTLLVYAIYFNYSL